MPKFIKLSQNENPFGPSPRALEAIGKYAPDVFRYPDLFHAELKQKITGIHGVGEDRIILGAGSVELIDLCIKALSRAGDSMVTAEVTFEGYRLLAYNNDRQVKLAPLKNYAIDLAAMRELCDETVRLVFIANPNNPTGTMTTHGELAGFLKSLPENVFVVCDEAYYEYVNDADYPNSLHLQGAFPNLVVFRTFSKIYGLAGLRLGYAIAAPETAKLIQSRRTPFSVSGIAATAAHAALDDRNFIDNCVRINAEQRDSLFQALTMLGYRAVKPAGNFIFIEFPTADQKNELFEYLSMNNILTRPLDKFGIHTGLRITVGKPEENRILVELLQNYSAP